MLIPGPSSGAAGPSGAATGRHRPGRHHPATFCCYPALPAGWPERTLSLQHTVKKEVILKTGGLVEIKEGSPSTKQAFFIKLYLNSSAYVTGDARDYYRLRPGSVMSASTGKRNYRMVRYFFLRWCSRYLKQVSFHHSILEHNLEAPVPPVPADRRSAVLFLPLPQGAYHRP